MARRPDCQHITAAAPAAQGKVLVSLVGRIHETSGRSRTLPYSVDSLLLLRSLRDSSCHLHYYPAAAHQTSVRALHTWAGINSLAAAGFRLTERLGRLKQSWQTRIATTKASWDSLPSLRATTSPRSNRRLPNMKCKTAGSSAYEWLGTIPFGCVR